MSKHSLKLLATALGSALLFAAAPAQAQTVLKIGHTQAKGSHYDVGTTVFCDEVEKGTAGRYKCQMFPAGAVMQATEGLRPRIRELEAEVERLRGSG